MNSTNFFCLLAFLALGSSSPAPQAGATTLEQAYDAAMRLVHASPVAKTRLPPARPMFPQDLSAIFGEDWKKMLFDLSRPAADCIRRRDDFSPVFHGCVDWHSSVHAFAALSRYTSLTGDRRYAGLIESLLSSDKLKEELRSIQENPGFEMPYGRAWFLKLHGEYKRAFGQSPKELDAIAELAAASLVDFYGNHEAAFEDDEYNNASWALANLWDYAVETGNRETQSFVRKRVEAHFFGHSFQLQRFFEPSLMSALLLSKTVDQQHFEAWQREHREQIDAVLEPLEPGPAHEAGLNFSRAWGIWSLYLATRDAKYLDSYRRLILWHYQHPQYWRDNYWAHAHWVPQFGIFAIGRAAEAR